MSRSLYRGTGVDWLVVFISNGGIRKQFNSVTKSKYITQQFGEIIIEFDEAEVSKWNKLVEVEYYRHWFEDHPEIARYVSGSSNFEEWLYMNGAEDYENMLDGLYGEIKDIEEFPSIENITSIKSFTPKQLETLFNTIGENWCDPFEEEEEIVLLRRFRYKHGMIKHVEINMDLYKQSHIPLNLTKLLKKHKISYSFGNWNIEKQLPIQGI